jgi:hypothetical protein
VRISSAKYNDGGKQMSNQPINLIPITNRCKSWLLDNIPTGLWNVTYVRNGYLPFSEEHLTKLVESMLNAGLNENDFILAKEQ